MKRAMKQGDYYQFTGGTRCKIVAVGDDGRFSVDDKGKIMTHFLLLAVVWSDNNQAWVRKGNTNR